MWLTRLGSEGLLRDVFTRHMKLKSTNIILDEAVKLLRSLKNCVTLKIYEPLFRHRRNPKSEIKICEVLQSNDVTIAMILFVFKTEEIWGYCVSSLGGSLVNSTSEEDGSIWRSVFKEKTFGKCSFLFKMPFVKGHRLRDATDGLVKTSKRIPQLQLARENYSVLLHA